MKDAISAIAASLVILIPLYMLIRKWEKQRVRDLKKQDRDITEDFY